MIGSARTLDPRLLRRQCVACGYDGALLRNGLAARCARCGCDLRERPARSYVEMEGFGRFPVRPARPSWPTEASRDAWMLHRWIAFMFFTMMIVVTMIYLSAAAFSV